MAWKFLTKGYSMDKQPQFIMISAHGTIETAVEATKKGALISSQNHPI